MVKLCDPSIVRDQCGLIIMVPRIGGETLRPPGTYEVYKGTTIYIRTATKCASYGAKTSVLKNGVAYWSWQDYEGDLNKVVTHEMGCRIDEDATFSIATYSFDGKTFTKTDEYGPWVLKVKEIPEYPYINKYGSGVLIDGELKPPGRYTVKKGTTITVQALIHSKYPFYRSRTAVLINGKVVKYWDEDRTGDILFKYPIVADRDMEITMAVYYYDESEGVYKKSDEYGCGGD